MVEAVKMAKPVLVGASSGGRELSSVGARYPERVKGLVYLDAAYSYAFDDGTIRSTEAILDELHTHLQELQTRAAAHDRRDSRDLVRALVNDDLPAAQKELSRFLRILDATAQLPKSKQPTTADLASFRAFQDFLYKSHGFLTPEG